MPTAAAAARSFETESVPRVKSPGVCDHSCRVRGGMTSRSGAEWRRSLSTVMMTWGVVGAWSGGEVRLLMDLGGVRRRRTTARGLLIVAAQRNWKEGDAGWRRDFALE